MIPRMHAGIRTSAGSKFFAENIPREDAFVVEKLKRAGALILGKTNTHEIALGEEPAPAARAVFGQEMLEGRGTPASIFDLVGHLRAVFRERRDVTARREARRALGGVAARLCRGQRVRRRDARGVSSNLSTIAIRSPQS